MQHVQLQPDLKLSRIVYGWWRLTEWQMSSRDIVQRIEDCLELGISSHDHADIYGDYQCEVIFGEALKTQPSLRDNIELISKCGIQLVSPQRPTHKRKNYDTSYAHICASAEQSLCNFGVEQLDLLLIHRPDPLMCAEEMARAFTDLRNSGKVRAFGASNFTPAQFSLLQSRLDFDLVTNQVEISVLHHDAFHDGSLDQAQQLARPPMAWSPLAGGQLFGGTEPHQVAVRKCLVELAQQYSCSVDQLAFAWLLKHPANIVPIVGSQSLTRINSACESLHLKLSRDHWYDIWEAADGLLP